MEEQKKSYYAIIPANVRYDANVTPNAKLLYGEITALCNERGYCWATNKYFADLYNVSKTSISKWIKSLEDNGYIESKIVYKEGTKEIENRYITIIPEGNKQKLDTYSTKVDTPIEEKLNTPIEEKLKDNNTLVNNTTNSTSNIIFNTPELDKVFNDWLDYKKEKRQSYTKKGLNSLINKIKKQLEVASVSNIVEDIENCMANNYQGIFFKERKQKTVDPFDMF